MMIERNLQNVTVRKYGTAFLEAFGMLPLTYFGARGDNLTDNYANIQVAIDESIKRGLRYIFVPNGTYLYTGNLLHVDEIIFIGNAKYAKIYNGVNELKIYQIGTQLPFEKGTYLIEGEINEPMVSRIIVKTLNSSEAILNIGENVIHVYNDLVTLNGKKFIKLEVGDVVITEVKLSLRTIDITYHHKTSGMVNISVDWMVR